MPVTRRQSTFSQIFDDVMADSPIISGNPAVRPHILATDNEVATQLLDSCVAVGALAERCRFPLHAQSILI